MKKLILSLGIVFGVFLIAGSVSANENVIAGEAIQPANASGATTGFDSIRVGTAGEGGVTFFNGSIVNEEGPVVIADDLRVDGKITGYGGPVKFGNTIKPTANDAYDVGNNSYKFKNGYFSRTVYAGNVIPNANNTYDIGTDSYKWRNGYFGNINVSEEISVNKIIGVGDNDIIIDGNVEMDGGNFGTVGHVYTRNLTVYNSIVVDHDILTHGDLGVLNEASFDDKLCGGKASYSTSGCDSTNNESLKLDHIVNIQPRNGQPYVCTNDYKGDLIFSTTAIGGQGSANRYYYCASAAEGWLQLF
jgi:hypothetical protein